MNQSTKRFTLDGSEELEKHLAKTCRNVADGVAAIVPARKLEAILLGGGYGRGEGGVLRTPFLIPTSSAAAKLIPKAHAQTELIDVPYNDLEFYVFIRGNTLINQNKYQQRLNKLGEELSVEAGLHVEFKIDSVEKFSAAPITMFSYDLLAGHKAVLGNEASFSNCAHHLLAEQIPLSEATRLLFNRSSGLLLAKERLSQSALSADDEDFIGRNLAKAQLAFGDVVLVAHQQYHWSCRERHKRLLLLPEAACPWLEEINMHHAAGANFKLHPRRMAASREAFQSRHNEISQLALKLWLWIESSRLSCDFASARDYAMSAIEKCAEAPRWRNYLLNLRTFGMRGVFGEFANRYPRERLFNALTLLLWDGESLRDYEVKRAVRIQLQTRMCDWLGMVAAYKAIWPSYG